MNAADLWREVARSFDVAYPHRWLLGLIIALAGLLTAVGLWKGFPSYPPVHSPSIYALLAGTPTVLSTLFVLAFTFTLVTAQIASNYSLILFRRILGLWALWYAVPFAAGFLLPLFLLNGHFFLWAVQVSLFMSSYCVLSLLPFAVAVRELLSVEAAVEELGRRLLETASTCQVRNLAKNICDITDRALTHRDFGTFDFGVRQLVLCSDRTETANSRLVIAQEIRRMTWRNREDPFAAESLIDAIVSVGFGDDPDYDNNIDLLMLDEISGAYRSANTAVFGNQEQAIRGMTEHAQRHPPAASKCQAILHVIGERAISEISVDTGSANSAIQALGRLLQHHVRSSNQISSTEQDLNSAIRRIETLGRRAKAHAKMDVVYLAVQQLRAAIAACSPHQEPLKRRLEAAISSVNNS